MIKQHLNDRISKHNFKTMKPNMETDTKLDHKYFSVVVFNMGNKVCGFTKLGVIIIVVGKGKKKKDRKLHHNCPTIISELLSILHRSLNWRLLQKNSYSSSLDFH